MPILHRYDLSPFAEKVRLAPGHKRLDWRSVEISIWPPRPDTAPLTAGYRRTPVLRGGGDVYRDTLPILAELERRRPEPTLYGVVAADGIADDRELRRPGMREQGGTP